MIHQHNVPSLIISFILITCLLVNVLIMLGEVRYWSLVFNTHYWVLESCVIIPFDLNLLYIYFSLRLKYTCTMF